MKRILVIVDAKHEEVTVESLMKTIEQLPRWKQRKLLDAILDTIRDEAAEPNAKTHSITELRGLGKEMWEGIDAQA